jgi:hypothetical protein
LVQPEAFDDDSILGRRESARGGRGRMFLQSASGNLPASPGRTLDRLTASPRPPEPVPMPHHLSRESAHDDD